MLKAINRKLFIRLSLAFVAATIIGTLSHEFGHYIVARKTGFKATIHYASTEWYNDKSNDYLHTITSESQGHKEERFIYEYSSHTFWIAMGGPIQTLLTGSIGLLLLFAYRKSYNGIQQLNTRQWLLIFIALFWIRQIANLVAWILIMLIKGEIHYVEDEIKIAQYLNLPFWFIITISGLIGALVLHTVIVKFIPKQQQKTFITAGLFGGITGFVFWFKFLGPTLMP